MALMTHTLPFSHADPPVEHPSSPAHVPSPSHTNPHKPTDVHCFPSSPSLTDSFTNATHTHSPTHILTTFSHACARAHTLSEPPSHHRFPSSVSHKHSLCQECSSAAEQPLTVFVTVLHHVLDLPGLGAFPPPPALDTVALYSSVIALFSQQLYTQHSVNSAD